MDTDDLTTLADRLKERGLVVDLDEHEQRLTVANPLNSRLSEDVSLRDSRYVTSFDYEIGETGAETACAERIARILAVGPASGVVA